MVTVWYVQELTLPRVFMACAIGPFLTELAISVIRVFQECGLEHFPLQFATVRVLHLALWRVIHALCQSILCWVLKRPLQKKRR